MNLKETHATVARINSDIQQILVEGALDEEPRKIIESAYCQMVEIEITLLRQVARSLGLIPAHVREEEIFNTHMYNADKRGMK